MHVRTSILRCRLEGAVGCVHWVPIGVRSRSSSDKRLSETYCDWKEIAEGPRCVAEIQACTLHLLMVPLIGNPRR